MQRGTRVFRLVAGTFAPLAVAAREIEMDRVALDGPMAFLYTRAVRKGVESGLPDGVDRLAVIAAGRG